MILFLQDWKKFPRAVVDIHTRNKSWLRLAGLLKSMGIKNHGFILALHNPDLAGIDPHDPTISDDTRKAIAIESAINPWYFFREVARLRGNIMVEANRLNIAMWWMFFNHQTTLCIAPRQIGKSSAVWLLDTYILEVAGMNTELHLLTKDDNLRVKSIRDIKAIIEYLPWYMNLKSKKDTYNTEQITVGALNNVYHTAVARSSEVDAASIGRGLTVACHRIDEFAFIKNIEVTLSSLMPTATKARESAAKKGLPYGNIFTTTAGYLSTKEGEYTFTKIYSECLKWRETFYDCEDNNRLVDMIRKNSPGRSMNTLIEMNHRQLGKTDEWLRENIRIAMVDGERAEAEFLNIWSRGNESCPISKEMLEVIHNSVIKDPYTWISKQGYILNLFVSLDEFKSRQLIVGMDTSDAIGNDDIAMIIRDPYSGEVLGSGLFNETNILTFSEFLVDLFVEFTNIAVMVIERKSTGSSIIDNLIKLLPLHGIDPFKKLFNWVVNNAQEKKEYMTDVLNKSLSSRNPEVYIKYKKEFGYATSAIGRSSRDNLYGSVFTSMIKYTGKYMRDEVLARQLAGLVRKNGRIDHRPGEHDDMCFIGSMLIRTIDGNKPIKDIKLGDLVFTREGYKPVIAIYKRKAKVITKFGITGTPSHPFITPSGIVEFKDLTNESEVYIWRNGRLLSTMAKNITDTQNRTEDISEFTIGNTISGKNHQLRYTGKYGWIIMEKYLQVITYIIKMAIQKIIRLKIWNAYLQKITLRNILCQKKLYKEQESEGLERINSLNGKKRILNLQESFMKKMGKNLKVLKSGKRVIRNCLKNCVVLMGRNQRKCTQSLEKIMEKNYENGTKITQSYQNLPQVNELKHKERKEMNDLELNYVYNLTIMDCHEYLVNDVLVHNCIGALLSLFVLLQGNNLSYYGLNTKMVLSSIANETIEEQGGIENIIDKENQSILMDKVYKLLDQIKAEPNPILTNLLINKVKHLTSGIDDSQKVNFNLDAILEEIKLKKKKYYN